jgi:hypothetical protein
VSKSGRPRHVYLTGEGAEFFEGLTVGRPRGALLLTHADASPWGPSHQHWATRDACLHAEIQAPISFHILRHSYASFRTKAGVPPKGGDFCTGSCGRPAGPKSTTGTSCRLMSLSSFGTTCRKTGVGSPKKARTIARLRAQEGCNWANNRQMTSRTTRPPRYASGRP